MLRESRGRDGFKGKIVGTESGFFLVNNGADKGFVQLLWLWRPQPHHKMKGLAAAQNCVVVKLGFIHDKPTAKDFLDADGFL